MKYGLRMSFSVTPTFGFWNNNFSFLIILRTIAKEKRNGTWAVPYEKINRCMGRCGHRPVFIYMFCFLIPKIILKIPPKNFGLLTNTTFIQVPSAFKIYQQRQQEIPSIITQIASIATKNLGGQKQLISSPKAKVRPKAPLLMLKRLRISFPPYNTVYRENEKVLL